MLRHSRRGTGGVGRKPTGRPMFAKLARATSLSATVAVSAALVGCSQSSIKDFVPAKATKELPPAMLSKMSSMGMARNAPVLARIFKEEGKLEIWKQKTNGRYAMIADYN